MKIRSWGMGSSIAAELKLEKPVLGDRDWGKQLSYIDAYVSDCEMGCASIGIEERYIDRHYIEDFAAFYSRSLEPIPNYCTRVHFFAASKKDVESALNEILQEALAARGTKRTHEVIASLGANRRLQGWYLGFTCIRPLQGAPVGTTVLKHFPRSVKRRKPKHHRVFNAVRPYTVHVQGVRLTVEGLAFQQQDVGVAACATTAIWTSLQKTRESVDMSQSSPANITLKATDGFVLGRSMPSEGLTLEQICAAIQSFNLSAHVIDAEKSGTAARWVLSSALLSGQAPILLLRKVQDAPTYNDEDETAQGCSLGDPGLTEGDENGGDSANSYHAVTAIGIKEPTRAARSTKLADPPKAIGYYVHDDRLGPYVLAEIDEEEDDARVILKLRTKKAKRNEKGEFVHPDDADRYEKWSLENVVVPTPPKIRLSFLELQSIVFGPRREEDDNQQEQEASGVQHVQLATLVSFLAHQYASTKSATGVRPQLGIYVNFAYAYLEDLMRECAKRSVRKPSGLQALMDKQLSRFVAVFRFTIGEAHELVDVVLDTTSTVTNPVVLAVIGVGSRRIAGQIATDLSAILDTTTCIRLMAQSK